MDIEQMKRDRDELDGRIRQAEKTKAEALKRTVLLVDYVQVACPACDGVGSSFQMNASDNSDLEEIDCNGCHGKGFLMARKWEGLKAHDFEHNQIISALD